VTRARSRARSAHFERARGTWFLLTCPSLPRTRHRRHRHRPRPSAALRRQRLPDGAPAERLLGVHLLGQLVRWPGTGPASWPRSRPCRPDSAPSASFMAASIADFLGADLVAVSFSDFFTEWISCRPGCARRPVRGLLVFLGVGLGVLHHALDLVLGQAGARLDLDLVLLAGALSFADTCRMPLASMSNVTSICGMPRGAGGCPTG
jgi:hypothetical protein